MPNLPNLGSKAPDFTANSTNGPIRLSDYHGKWVVLFSHPGDFSPVCTTEFLEFTKHYKDFKERNTELLAINSDSNNAHLAWMYNIFLITGVEIPFPILEDRDLRISRTYGMISKPTETYSVRSVFIIDSNQILRTILYYPVTTGRNIPEILRIVSALQTTDEKEVFTPANWFPGQQVILPHPKKYKDLKNSLKNCSKKYSSMDWYLCFVPHECDKASTFKKNLFDDKIVDKHQCEESGHKEDLDMEKEVSEFYNKNYINHNYEENKNIKEIAKGTLDNYSKKKNNHRPQISDLFNVINEELECPDLDRIVAQYVFGNPTNLDVQLIDAAIYAFVEIRPDGTLMVPTPNFLRQIVNLKAEKPSLKAIAAIGGWGAEGFRYPSSKYPYLKTLEITKATKNMYLAIPYPYLNIL